MSARESIGRQVCVWETRGGREEGGSVKGRRTGTVNQTWAFLHELFFKTLYLCGDWFSRWQLVNLSFSNNKTGVLYVQRGIPPKTRGCFPEDLVWEWSPSRDWQEEGSPKGPLTHFGFLMTAHQQSPLISATEICTWLQVGGSHSIESVAVKKLIKSFQFCWV